MDSDQVNQILLEIVNGKPPSDTSAEAAEMRRQIEKEVADIESRGGIVDVPWEHPDLDDSTFRAGGFNPDQERDESGKWSAGGGLSAPEKALQNRLVDFKLDRNLTGPASKAIDEAIPGAHFTHYVRVPALAKMHAAMDVEPTTDTDPLEYQKSRDKLFGTMPVKDVPFDQLTFTQPRVNADRYNSLADAPSQLNKPVQLLKTGDKYYVMNGHHRAVGAFVAGRETLKGHVFDADHPKSRAAARKVSPLIKTADSFQKKFETSFSYALLRGRQAARKGPAAVEKAIHDALIQVLPKVLLEAVIACGETGAKMLSSMRSAEFNPDQERDESGKWTDGGGSVEDSKRAIKEITSRAVGGKRKKVNLDALRRMTDDDVIALNRHYGLLATQAETMNERISAQATLNAMLDELSRRKLRTAAKRFGPLKMEFNPDNEYAREWAREHAAELAVNISETTRERIANAVVEFHTSGEDPYEAILAAVGDERRAQVIAHHETMVAAHEGQHMAWDQAIEEGLLIGNEKRVWIVTPDGKTCPVCEELEGTKADLDGEYADGIESPPAHVGCRCSEGLV